MQLPYLFCQPVLGLCLGDWYEQSCPLIRHDPSGVCRSCFPGQPVTHIYNVENMVPQEDEAVSPIADGELWRSAHITVYKKFGLVLDMR